MGDALNKIAGASANPWDAVLTACALEASAPKAGNVTPDKSFADLQYSDFLIAAFVASEAYARGSDPVCQRTLAAAIEVAEQLQTNVNLGILLLLTPIIAADESNSPATLSCWQSSVAEVLANFTSKDSSSLLRAIQVSSAGGLGKVDQMDVNEMDDNADFDIMAAMRLAASRDRIAKTYADEFKDFFGTVVPVVCESLGKANDPLQGIADAHLILLAAEVDTLIVRKCGIQVAKDVQNRAAKVDLDDPVSRDTFDAFLRSQSNRLNPGTTADLIAAALYVILRTDPNGL